MSDQRYSICLVSTSLQMGGLERAMSNLANYFNEKGHHVTYIVQYRFEQFYKLNDGIELIEPDFDFGSTSKLVYYSKILKYLRREVKKCQPQTVLSFGDYHNAFVIFALLGTGIPVYVSDRSSPNKRFGKALTVFKKWMYPKSAGIVAQTERAAIQKRQMLGEQINVSIIPNTVRKIELPLVEKKKQILGVGRHHKVKGFDRLLRAYARLNTDWDLVLAGDRGPESENLKTLAREIGLSERVVFLGSVKDIDRVYSEAGIFVLTSRSEGFPNALCEAMAAGIPCVSYDIVAGPSDIIRHGENGFLVEDNNEEALVHTLRKLMEDEGLRSKIGSNARRLQDELSLHRSGNRYLEFITSHLR